VTAGDSINLSGSYTYYFKVAAAKGALVEYFGPYEFYVCALEAIS